MQCEFVECFALEKAGYLDDAIMCYQSLINNNKDFRLVALYRLIQVYKKKSSYDLALEQIETLLCELISEKESIKREL